MLPDDTNHKAFNFTISNCGKHEEKTTIYVSAIVTNKLPYFIDSPFMLIFQRESLRCHQFSSTISIQTIPRQKHRSNERIFH